MIKTRLTKKIMWVIIRRGVLSHHDSFKDLFLNNINNRYLFFCDNIIDRYSVELPQVIDSIVSSNSTNIYRQKKLLRNTKVLVSLCDATDNSLSRVWFTIFIYFCLSLAENNVYHEEYYRIPVLLNNYVLRDKIILVDGNNLYLRGSHRHRSLEQYLSHNIIMRGEYICENIRRI